MIIGLELIIGIILGVVLYHTILKKINKYEKKSKLFKIIKIM